MANRRTNPDDGIGERDHESTWGTSEVAKEAWTDKNADQARKNVERGNEDKEKGGA